MDSDDIVVTARRIARSVSAVLTAPLLPSRIDLPQPILDVTRWAGISDDCAQSTVSGACSTTELATILSSAALLVAIPELIAGFSSEGVATSIAFTTGKRSITNVTADISVKQVSKNLVKSGFRRSVSQDGKAIVFEKGGVRYSYYVKSNSTEGPSLLLRVNGSNTAKLRVKP